MSPRIIQLVVHEYTQTNTYYNNRNNWNKKQYLSIDDENMRVQYYYIYISNMCILTRMWCKVEKDTNCLAKFYLTMVYLKQSSRTSGNHSAWNHDVECETMTYYVSM